MSYDYVLIKGTQGDELEMLAESAMSEPIGTVMEVQSKITEFFPAVQWETSANTVAGLEGGGVFSHGGPPEFQLTLESDGLVYMITMSRAERSEVEQIALKLGAVVIDEQSMDMFGG